MDDQSRMSVYLEGTITAGHECGCQFLETELEKYDLDGDLDGFTCGDRVGVWGTLCPTCVSICMEGTVFVVETIVALPADSDGDTLPDSTDNCPSVATVWFVPPGDGDCDGFTDADEGDIGTDPNVFCGAGCWPPDFDDNQVINISDVFQVLPPYFGSSTGGPDYSERQDLVPDGVINISDVFKVLPPYFGASCTP